MSNMRGGLTIKKQRKNHHHTALTLSTSLFLTILTSLTGCGQPSPEEQLIGYWMGPYGGTIAFTDEQNCTYGETQCTYKVYDDTHIQLSSSDGSTQDLTFKFESDKLYLKSTGTNNAYEEYTKDETEQQKIIERNQSTQQQALQQAQEQEAAQQQQLEKEEKIAKIRADIEEQERLIEDAESRIKNNEKDIRNWEKDIEQQKRECEEAIAFGDDPEYQENQRDEFIAADEEAIKGCRDRIRELRKEIKGYKAEVRKLKKEMLKVEGE